MRFKHVRAKLRWLPTLVALLLVLSLGTALAGSNSTTLPNGAALEVSIDDPVTSTEFEVPPGASTIDVDVSGTASVGLGEPDATFVYVIDVSGSTDHGSGTGCNPILECEQIFIKALNAAAITDGSVDEVGVVVFASSSATADMSSAGGDQKITDPNAGPGDVNTVVDSTYSLFGGDGGVGQFANKVVGVQTDFTAGLQKALDVVNASTNGTNIVVFISDGASSEGGSGFDAAVAALNSAGATVHSIAIGSGNTCTAGSHGTLQAMADGTGGTCSVCEDPGQLPDIIPDLISSHLDLLEIEVDGGAKSTIPNAEIVPDLPQPGAVSVDYDTTVSDLGPADHLICVTANGHDPAGSGSVAQCETIHLLQLTASPPAETNELGSDNAHTVDASILGDPGQVAGREVVFTVSGQNAGATGTGSTDAAGQVSFGYSVPVEPDSLGSDTIHVCTEIAGADSCVDVTKDWVDTTPPETSCLPTVNPSGKKVPPAGDKSPGQNEDAFYELTAWDDVWPDESLEVFVEDTGSGTVFGPYPVGTKIKYTEDADATPEAKKIGSDKGKADAVDVHIIGKGDPVVYAVDGSGNQSSNATCFVPPPPK